MMAVEHLARLVAARSCDELSDTARLDLKICILDALGCAFGAAEAKAVQSIRPHLEDLGGNPLCTLIGCDATTTRQAAPDNGAHPGANARLPGVTPLQRRRIDV